MLVEEMEEGFTSCTELRYYEVSRLYFRLEKPHHDLEFLLNCYIYGDLHGDFEFANTTCNKCI